MSATASLWRASRLCGITALPRSRFAESSSFLSRRSGRRSSLGAAAASQFHAGPDQRTSGLSLGAGRPARCAQLPESRPLRVRGRVRNPASQERHYLDQPRLRLEEHYERVYALSPGISSRSLSASSLAGKAARSGSASSIRRRPPLPKTEWSRLPLRLCGLESVQLHADLTFGRSSRAPSQGLEPYRSLHRPLLKRRLAPQESRAPLSLLPRRVARASAAFALWGPGLMAAGPAPRGYSFPGTKTKQFRRSLRQTLRWRLRRRSRAGRASLAQNPSKVPHASNTLSLGAGGDGLLTLLVPSAATGFGARRKSTPS